MKKEKKMSYLGMECVLSHMDFNFRQSLTKRCRSVQSLDKKLPLKIETLIVDSTFIQINDIDYGMGIIQQYDDHNTPKHILNINDQGGFEREVDRYGFQDSVCPHIMKQSREHLESVKLKYETELERIENEETDLGQRKNRLRMQRLINEVESLLLPYLLKEQNLDPPYKHYLQLRITSDKHSKPELERLENRKTLSEARSDLLDYLIPKRKIFINNFIVYNLQSASSVQRILENDDAFYSIKLVSLASLKLDSLMNYKHPLVSIRNYSALNGSQINYICQEWSENLSRDMHLVLESMDRTSAFQILDNLKQRNPVLINGDPDDYYEFVRIRKNAEFELKLYLKPTTKNDKFDFHVELNKRS